MLSTKSPTYALALLLCSARLLAASDAPSTDGVISEAAAGAIEALLEASVKVPEPSDEACRRHVWKIPSRYNIALDICDRHAGAGRRALVWEGPEGPGETYTFDDLTRLSDRLASGLRALGVGRGDRVALMLPQTPEHALAHVAILKLGAISVPLSRLFGLDALRYRLADSGACALFADGESVRAYWSARTTPRWRSPTSTRTVCSIAGCPPKPSRDSSSATWRCRSARANVSAWSGPTIRTRIRGCITG